MLSLSGFTWVRGGERKEVRKVEASRTKKMWGRDRAGSEDRGSMLRG